MAFIKNMLLLFCQSFLKLQVNLGIIMYTMKIDIYFGYYI